MNKSELIDAIAKSTDSNKAEAGRALEAVLGAITSTLQSGEKVTIPGFGTFEVRHRNARMGRNPQTGESIQIKASNTPGFKAGKALKDALN
ncbi:MAG: DNA-binding protein HU [Gammaproteobacteria bacterium]|jgi:DNA-binding protein HU-beta|nr:DNA-binding protein HU [Gammaproteobacteria bacterium]